MSSSFVPRALRRLVAEQARHRCGYCLTLEELIGAPMEVDHIIPTALGGLSEENNLWLACSFCNLYKGTHVVGLDPLTDQYVPLFNPRQQVWEDHFTWSSDFERIIGKTAIGRATVVLLRLNRPLLVQSRRVWVAAGLHPAQD